MEQFGTLARMEKICVLQQMWIIYKNCAEDLNQLGKYN